MEKILNFLLQKIDGFKYGNKFILIGIIFFCLFSRGAIKLNEPGTNDLKKKFLIEIQRSFTENKKVNINKIEELIFKNDLILKNEFFYRILKNLKHLKELIQL